MLLTYGLPRHTFQEPMLLWGSRRVEPSRTKSEEHFLRSRRRMPLKIGIAGQHVNDNLLARCSVVSDPDELTKNFNK